MSIVASTRLAVLTCLVSVLCFSCRKDPVVTQEVPVVGTWQCITADFGTLSEDAVGMITKDDKITLNDDGNYYLDSKKLKQSGKWKKEGNKLIIITPDKTLNFTIVELTMAKLSTYIYYNGNTLKFTFVRV